MLAHALDLLTNAATKLPNLQAPTIGQQAHLFPTADIRAPPKSTTILIKILFEI